MFPNVSRIHPSLVLVRLLAVAGLLGLTAASAGWTGVRAQTSSTVLSGYVFNYKGEFMPGATITLYSQPAHQQVGQQTVTDAKGTFTLDTGTGTFAIDATAPGYDFAEQTIYATSYQTGITFILRPNQMQAGVPLMATVSGHVTSLDNVPLGGMNIVSTDRRDTGVRQVAPPAIFSAALTDANGNYSMQVPAGQIWMTLKTGAVWGYQLEPMNINAGDNKPGTDFRAAVRVLPRLALPTATPAPSSNVGPLTGVGNEPGMPRTGGGSTGLLLLLLVGGLLALGSGGLLTHTARSRR